MIKDERDPVRRGFSATASVDARPENFGENRNDDRKKDECENCPTPEKDLFLMYTLIVCTYNPGSGEKENTHRWGKYQCMVDSVWLIVFDDKVRIKAFIC